MVANLRILGNQIVFIFILDRVCNEPHIQHKKLRLRTPWHNAKVQRSHRNDQERFYNHLSFYSYDNVIFGKTTVS